MSHLPFKIESMSLFLSHEWNVHDRVVQIARVLRGYGRSVWLDEEQMVHDIDSCMAKGIEACEWVVIFLTKRYCEKVDGAARNPVTRMAVILV